MAIAQENTSKSPIGKRTPRVDGPLKVTGQAKYTSDFHFPGLLYAVPVEATIAKGRILKLDTTTAEKMPGVQAIFHRGNIGKISRAVQGEGFEGIMEERRPPFDDDVIRYYGQYVALAVANTFENAKAAADAVRVDYEKQAAKRRHRSESGRRTRNGLHDVRRSQPRTKRTRRCRSCLRQGAGQAR